MMSRSPQWTSALQLSGMDLLPLNLAKQNLLYGALDCMGLNSAVGMGWLQISHVSEAWYWEPQRGDVGQANITLRTMRDKPGVAIGEVCRLLHTVSHSLLLLAPCSWWRTPPAIRRDCLAGAGQGAAEATGAHG